MRGCAKKSFDVSMLSPRPTVAALRQRYEARTRAHCVGTGSAAVVVVAHHSLALGLCSQQ